jgi:hypothetical protein
MLEHIGAEAQDGAGAWDALETLGAIMAFLT